VALLPLFMTILHRLMRRDPSGTDIFLEINSCRAFTEVPGLRDGHLEHRLTDKFTKIDETRFTASTIGAIIVSVEPQIAFQQGHSFDLL